VGQLVGKLLQINSLYLVWITGPCDFHRYHHCNF
jgi:hypothetical protein